MYLRFHRALRCIHRAANGEVHELNCELHPTAYCTWMKGFLPGVSPEGHGVWNHQLPFLAPNSQTEDFIKTYCRLLLKPPFMDVGSVIDHHGCQMNAKLIKMEGAGERCGEKLGK